MPHASHTLPDQTAKARSDRTAACAGGDTAPMRCGSLAWLAMTFALFGISSAAAGEWTTTGPASAKAVVARPATKSAPTPVASKAEARADSAPATGILPQTLFLVRSTLMALNDANRTGNYTVLRDLAAPAVRNRTSSADFAAVFAALRKGNIDLSIAAVVPPELSGPPMLDAAQRMHVRGEYPTQPSRIVFEVVFESVNGHWLLSDLSISTRQAAKTAAIEPQR